MLTRRLSIDGKTLARFPRLNSRGGSLKKYIMTLFTDMNISPGNMTGDRSGQKVPFKRNLSSEGGDGA